MQRIMGGLVGACILLSIGGLGADTAPILPNAIAARDRAINKAEDDYVKAVTTATKAYRDQLDKAMKDAMHAADLNRANQIKAEMDKCDADLANLQRKPVGAEGPALVVTSARYGRAQSWVDITSIVSPLVKEGHLLVPNKIDMRVRDPIAGYKLVDMHCVIRGQPVEIRAFDAGEVDGSLEITVPAAQ